MPARAGYSKSRMLGMWLLGAKRQKPAMDYYRWLLEIARNPEKYPEFMESYLKGIMPQIGEWATAGGIYNPAAVARKASQNLFPYLMNLGMQGAAGLAGTPLPTLQPPGPESIEFWGPMLGAAGGAASQMAGSYLGGMGSQGGGQTSTSLPWGTQGGNVNPYGGGMLLW